jgi:drug/metabolite transporter (DMT)-like permease
VIRSPLEGATLVLSITGVMAQLMLLQALKYTAAITLQPFNYSLLVLDSVLGVVWFHEALETTLVVGALLVVLGEGAASLRFKGSRV